MATCIKIPAAVGTSMITEVGTVFRTARERSLSITTRPRDFQGTSAPLPLLGARGVGAAASVVSTAVVGVVATLVVVVGIVAVVVSAALVAAEEVGVVVG